MGQDEGEPSPTHSFRSSHVSAARISTSDAKRRLSNKHGPRFLASCHESHGLSEQLCLAGVGGGGRLLCPAKTNTLTEKIHNMSARRDERRRTRASRRQAAAADLQVSGPKMADGV